MNLKPLLLLMATLPSYALEQGRAEQTEQPSMSLESSIAIVVASVDSEPPSKAVIRSTINIDSGRGVPPSPWTKDYALLGHNLWQIHSFGTIKDGGIESTSLSLCGIVELLSQTESQVKFVKRYFVGVGKYAIPLPFPVFSMPISRQSTSKSRTSTLLLGANAKNICSPQPGGAFDFEVETEMQMALKATFLSDSDQVLRNRIHWSCVVGQSKPLSDLTEGQDGQYLPVACALNNKDKGVESEVTLAYLPAARAYFKLGTKAKAFQSLIEVKSLAFE